MGLGAVVVGLNRAALCAMVAAMLQGLAERCCTQASANGVSETDDDADEARASEPVMPEANASLFELPELGDADDDGIGMLDEAVELAQLDASDGGDPFDDSVADDLATGIELNVLSDPHGSALGDDAAGLDDDDAASSSIGIPEPGASFIGEEQVGLDAEHSFLGDESLGIDPIVREEDDGGAEGLDDPGGERVDPNLFPPLDASDDSDDSNDDALFSDVALPVEG